MKVSTFLLVTCGAIIVGAATYSICKYYQNKNNGAKVPQSNSNDNGSNICMKQTVMSKFEKVQHDTANSIKMRHNVAAQQIKDTLNGITDHNTEFDKTINQINDDLDDLMK